MDGMKGDLASSGFTFLTVVVAEDHGRMSGLEQRPAQTQRRSLHYKVMDVQRLSAVLPLPSASVQPRFSRMFPVVNQQVLRNSQETRVMCAVFYSCMSAATYLSISISCGRLQLSRRLKRRRCASLVKLSLITWLRYLIKVLHPHTLMKRGKSHSRDVGNGTRLC